MSSRRVVIVGGGVGGASAALRLGRAGIEVVLVERSDHLGGLVMSLDVGGTPIERFYHHVFPHEHEIIEVIDQMGLAPRLEWFRSSVAMLRDQTVWPFTSPLDLMRFGPLPPLDRVRSGLGALLCGRTTDWASLDATPAREWLISLTGRRGYEAIWEPLLRAKFGSAADDVPAAWMCGRLQQRAAARRGGTERLGYLRGGFRRLFDALEGELGRLGVKLQMATAVTSIGIDDGRVTGVETEAGPLEADAVLYAGTLPGLAPLVPVPDRDPRWDAIGGLGAMAVVVELRRRITDAYWVNVCEPSLPITAYVEHTNLVPSADYGGRHLAYLARYFTEDDATATADIEVEAQRWIEALAHGGLPGFHMADVVAIHPARTPYAAPLVATGHLGRIPPVRSHIAGLYVATTAQIYPQDRGMSEGIRLATEAARHLMGDVGPGRRAVEGLGHETAVVHMLAPVPPDPAREPPAVPDGGPWSCPVCEGRDHRPRFEIRGVGTEGGVTPEAFRPSSDRYGQSVATVVVCERCRHATLAAYPQASVMDLAYRDAADPISLREEAGQVATAARAIVRLEAHTPPGRLVDVGCWTGSLLVAARGRGWEPLGLEPSAWASARARARGLDVRTSALDGAALETGAFRAVVMCDVLEHLADPASAVDEAHRALRVGGALYITVPDAGSPVARLLGRRWWSVLPMHLQYFTRSSMRRLLESTGFRVVSERSHAKVFSARYYGERLGGYSPRAGRAAVSALCAAGLADRLVAPNLGDRLEVIAVSR